MKHFKRSIMAVMLIILVIALGSFCQNVSGEDASFWSSLNTVFGLDQLEYYYSWQSAFGYLAGDGGEDLQHAEAVRFDTKSEGEPESPETKQYFETGIGTQSAGTNSENGD